MPANKIKTVGIVILLLVAVFLDFASKALSIIADGAIIGFVMFLLFYKSGNETGASTKGK